MNVLIDYGVYVVLAMQFLLAWGAWSMRRAFATKTDHSALALRVGVIEHEMKHMPTKDELHDLQLELSETVGEIKLVRAEYGSLMGLVTRVEAVATRHEQIFVDAARSR